MSTWADLEAASPELAANGRRLLGGDGATIAMLATVRKDGGPRVHPVMPVFANGSLYVFVVNLSYKYKDLLRDGRYALHCSPSTAEEFYVTGPAQPEPDAAVRGQVREASGNRLGGLDFEVLFQLGIERVLHTRWENWGTAETWPNFTKWPVPHPG